MKMHLQDGEVVLHTERLSLASVVAPSIIGVFLLVAPFFFFFPFLQFGIVGLLPLCILSLFGLFLVARSALRWRGSACVLTTQRVMRVEQRGFLDRKVVSAPLQAIQDVAFRAPGFLGALFHVGSVRITFRGVIPTMHILSVVRPDVLHDLISELHTLSLESGSVPTEFERVHIQRLP